MISPTRKSKRANYRALKRVEGKGFYSYLWLRENGTPYYVGKGREDRAYRFHRNAKIGRPRNKEAIVIFPMQSEADALESEKLLIELFGRKNNGTGILRNLSDGGDGPGGCIRSEETRRKLREANFGKKRPLEDCLKISKALKGRTLSAEHRQRIAEATKGNKRFLGHKHSEENRQKMRKAMMGNKHGFRATGQPELFQ